MGIFNIVNRLRNRRRFNKLLTAKTEITSSLTKGETKHFQFVMVSVDATNDEELPAIVTAILDTITTSEGLAPTIEGGLIVKVLGFGFPFAEEDSMELRMNLVNALLAEHSRFIRIAHGEAFGLCGLIGSKQRFSLGVVIPNRSAIVRELLEQPLGTAIDVSAVAASRVSAKNSLTSSD